MARRRWFSIRPGLTLKGRQFKGLRGWAGKPFHPPLTDFPLVAYVFAAAFDTFSYIASIRGDQVGYWATDFHTAATYALIAGQIVVLPTALTGFWDWLRSTPKGSQAWRTANFHMALMGSAAVVMTINIIVRITSDAAHTGIGVWLLSVVGALLVSWGAVYGGELVYHYGFNVETAGDHPAWHESEEDIYPEHED